MSNLFFVCQKFCKLFNRNTSFVNEKYEYIRINLTEMQDLYMDKNGNFALVHKKFFN